MDTRGKREKVDVERDGLRYGVMGAGLIGTYLGGRLAQVGRDVVMVGRPATRGAIARNGLRLTHYDRPEARPESFAYETEIGALSGCDVILLCVKSQATEEVGRELAARLTHSPLVVTFQNGVSNARRLEEILTDAVVLPGLVPFNVASPEPGRFHQGTEGDLYVRAYSDKRLMALKAAFEEAGVGMELRAPMRPLLWGKLLMNLNNPLNALWGGPLRAGLMQGPYRRVLAAMIGEALDVLRAAEIEPESPGKLSPKLLPFLLRLPTPIYAVLMAVLLKIDPEARSSMLEDLEGGRTSENTYLQDEIIRLGRRFGVRVETNRRVAEAVADAFKTGESPKLSGREMARRFLGR